MESNQSNVLRFFFPWDQLLVSRSLEVEIKKSRAEIVEIKFVGNMFRNTSSTSGKSYLIGRFRYKVLKWLNRLEICVFGTDWKSMNLDVFGHLF